MRREVRARMLSNAVSKAGGGSKRERRWFAEPRTDVMYTSAMATGGASRRRLFVANDAPQAL
jgi:hypothetical protein